MQAVAKEFSVSCHRDWRGDKIKTCFQIYLTLSLILNMENRSFGIQKGGLHGVYDYHF